MRPLLGAGLVALAALAAAGPAGIPERGRSYEGIVQTIAEEAPDAPVLALKDTQLVLGYYETRLGVDLRIRPVPGPFPRLRVGLLSATGVADLTVETAAALVAELGQAETVWLVSRGSASAQTLQALRQALRDSGRRESVLLGGIGSGDAVREVLIRYGSN